MSKLSFALGLHPLSFPVKRRSVSNEYLKYGFNSNAIFFVYNPQPTSNLHVMPNNTFPSITIFFTNLFSGPSLVAFSI